MAALGGECDFIEEIAVPYPLIMIFLVTAGFARSFFFTGINSLGYSEIDDSQASQATSMSSVLQQISLALGVAVAAAIRGTLADVRDFQ